MGFPKYVFKNGTGTQVNDTGLFTAESALVASDEELAALGPGWCDSPADAGVAADAKQGTERRKTADPRPEPEEAERPYKKLR